MNSVRIAAHAVVALAILVCAFGFRNNPGGRRFMAYAAAIPVMIILGATAGVALLSRIRSGGLFFMTVGFMVGGACGVFAAVIAGRMAVQRDPAYWAVHLLLAVIIIGWPFIIGA